MSYAYVDLQKKVIQAICASLALEEDQVKADSRLIDELGMDSLDFLDIMFALEESFATKIRDAEFDRVLRPDKSEIALQKEFLSDEELDRLVKIIPALKEAAQHGKVKRRELFSFVTVETLIILVGQKVLTNDQARRY
ncbi:MAG: acyl carrier protein [bacterium]|nr:acyl carrier protein [bacterium]